MKPPTKKKPKPRAVPERVAWEAYEREKRRLQTMDLTPKQYDEAIRKLTEKLGL